ncbi:MAG: hypothetical protein Q8P61_00025, partial [Candidatus Nanopelagicales bacterium]|nr:hypothetical protein [Candidatus Nanopelagicales bacterium]
MVSRHDYEKQFKSFGALSGVAELAGVIAHQSSLQQVLRGNEQMLGADVATSLPSILGRSGMRLLRPSAAALKSLHSNNRSLPSMPSMQELAVSSWGAQEVAALLSRAVVELPVDPDSDAGIAFGELLNEGAFHGNGPFHPELMSALDA